MSTGDEMAPSGTCACECHGRTLNGVHGCCAGSVPEDRDRLARQLADLRMSLGYAAGQWASNAMPHTHPARSAEYRSVMAACARDLRYALKANAPDAADVRAELDRLRELLGEVLDEFERLIIHAEPTGLISRDDLADYRQRAAPEGSQ